MEKKVNYLVKGINILLCILFIGNYLSSFMIQEIFERKGCL